MIETGFSSPCSCCNGNDTFALQGADWLAFCNDPDCLARSAHVLGASCILGVDPHQWNENVARVIDQLLQGVREAKIFVAEKST